MELKLKSGTTLIVDRYSYSGVAFSSAKGLDIEWCKVKKLSFGKKRKGENEDFLGGLPFLFSLEFAQLLMFSASDQWFLNFAGPRNWVAGSRSGSIP